MAYVLIHNESGNYPDNYRYQSIGLLVQGSGNGFWKNSLPSKIVELDKEKKHYITIEAGGYNGEAFTINNGFGEYASWIQAKKIR